MFGMSQNSFRLMYQTHRRVTQRCTETYIRLLFVHGPGTRTFKFVFLIKRHQEVRWNVGRAKERRVWVGRSL